MAKSLAVTVRNRKTSEKANVQTQVPVPPPTHGVVKREKLWDGGFFLVDVPVDAKLREGVRIGKEYLQFYRPVAHGKVNVFIHAKNPSQFLGKQICCQAEIWQKNYEDGRQFIYVDFYFVGFVDHDAHRPATHDWRVIQGKEFVVPKKMAGLKNINHFATPAPLEGFVVIGEL